MPKCTQIAQMPQQCKKAQSEEEAGRQREAGKQGSTWGGGAAFSLLVTLGSVFVLAAEPLSRAYKIHTLHFSRLPTRLDGCHAPAQPSFLLFFCFLFFWVTHGETFCQMQFTSVCFIAAPLNAFHDPTQRSLPP